MGRRVADVGRKASESQFVMSWIEVQTLPHSERWHAKRPTGLSTRDSLSNHRSGKADDGRVRSSWCARWRKRLRATSGYRGVHCTVVSASYHGAFERLEPVDWKLSNPVLRGRRTGNSPLLPDRPKKSPENNVWRGQILRIRLM